MLPHWLEMRVCKTIGDTGTTKWQDERDGRCAPALYSGDGACNDEVINPPHTKREIVCKSNR